MREFLPAQFNDVGSKGADVPSEKFAPVADNAPAAQTLWRSRTVWIVIVCGIILVGAIIAATGAMLLHLRERELAENDRDMHGVALALAEQIDRNLQSIEIIQKAVIERMQGLGIASVPDLERHMSGPDIHQRFKDHISALPHIEALVLTDPNGKLVNFSRFWPLPDVKPPDDDPAKVFKSDPRLTFLVGKPVRSPVTGAWSVPVARKFSGPDGEFIGVVIGVMRTQYFEQLFAAVAKNAKKRSIALASRDGTLFARYPYDERLVGRSLANHAIFTEVLAKSDHGTVRQPGMLDGEELLIAAYSLPHYPLAVIVTRTVASALARWRSAAIYVTGATIMIALVIGGAVFFSARLVGKKLLAQNLQLDAALNNMSQGLAMFDAAGRLIVCNRRYLEMYGLSPESTQAGSTVLDLLKRRKMAGSFSGDPEQYVHDLRAKIAQGKTTSIVTELRDGRTIVVVNQPMPGGGWVATHEDVTEAKQREASFRLLFENNPVPMWLYDVKSLRFLAVNQAAVAHYGYSRAQFLAMTTLDIRPAEERERFIRFVRSHGGGHDGELTWRHQKADGSIIDVAIYARALNYQDQAAALVAVHDITARKRAEDQLRRTRKFLDAVIENVPLPILVKEAPGAEKDARGCRLILVNRACEELYGVPREQIIGKTSHELYPQERADFIVTSDNAMLRSDQPVLMREHVLVTPGNGLRLVTARKVAIRDDDGKPQYLLTMPDDVTERRRVEQRIAHMAHHDPLTDLPNRAAFNECLAATLERAAAAGEHFAILCVDLDNFKEINDVHGHAIGDALLCEAARRLQRAAREAFLARVGGDEFMLIVADGAQPTAALAARLLAAFVDEFEVKGRRLKLGLSIGGALYPSDGADAETLLINADVALYQAKAEARGGVLSFTPEKGERLRERRALQEDLRSAIAREELHLRYQPQKKITGEIIGFEALIRWQCPKRGMVFPDAFIAIAEESGLIMPIGEWVLREACREAASWPRPLSVSVNISPAQFRHGDLPRLVHAILLETGLAASRLELEITEGVLIDDFPRAVAILRRLKALGVQIALDDFGKGYSSLSYLHSFPFGRIKIDHSFIRDLDHNRYSLAIIRAIIGLAHSLDVPVLAEGVETESQHAFLAREGCDEVQGFLTGRPLPIEDYADLVGRAAAAPPHDMAAVG